MKKREFDLQAGRIYFYKIKYFYIAWGLLNDISKEISDCPQNEE